MSALLLQAQRALAAAEDGPGLVWPARGEVTRARALIEQHLADVEQAEARAEEARAALSRGYRRAVPAPADYPVAEVRAWARAQGLAVPARGAHLPLEVVDAWRASVA